MYISAWIESHVSILAEASIGDCVRIQANTAIGSEGFGFAPYQGQWHRIAQLGGVRIGHQVRIGSNCSVDRGALDDTVIDDGVILDNLVQVAHNVQIGQHTAIAANTVIAGSTSIGAHCIIGGASAIAGHLTIADQVQFTGMSMVTKSIHQAGNYSSGTGLLESTAWRKAVVGFRQLSEMPINKLLKQIKVLASRIDQLESHQTVEQANERPDPNDDTKPNSKHDA
jgi:UDP-3-O-[3-hydroxymyristoyl] glucosamine N-acyltransferase